MRSWNWRIIWPLAATLLGIGFLVYVWGWVHPTLEATRLALAFTEKIMWPTVAILALLLFRDPLVKLVGNLDSVKFSAGGMSIEGSGQIYNQQTGNKLAMPIEEQVRSRSRFPDVASGMRVSSEWIDKRRESEFYALADLSPNMAMLHAFIELESKLRIEYRNRYPLEESAREMVSVHKITSHLDDEARDLIRYLAEVRNGIVHGTAPHYSFEDALAYIKQCILGQIAITSPVGWAD